MPSIPSLAVPRHFVPLAAISFDHSRIFEERRDIIRVNSTRDTRPG